METFSLESYFIEDYFNDWAVRPDTTEIAQESFTFVSKYLNVITVEEKAWCTVFFCNLIELFLFHHALY